MVAPQVVAEVDLGGDSEGSPMFSPGDVAARRRMAVGVVVQGGGATAVQGLQQNPAPFSYVEGGDSISLGGSLAM